MITDEELLDLTSVAKSLPGTMIANVAMLYGYRAGGTDRRFSLRVRHGVSPYGYPDRYQFLLQNFSQQLLGYGSHGGHAGRSGSHHCRSCSENGERQRQVQSLCPCRAGKFELYIFFQVNAVYLVIMGVAAGLLIGEYYARKEAGGHGAP